MADSITFKSETATEKMGQEALTQFILDNDISLITGVYGDPCTPLLDRLTNAGLPVEISFDEKIALAQALGASVAGKRSVVAVKQVGMNVLVDPLATAVTHGIGAGLLIICGDDPGAAKSQNEQDSRWYAPLTEIPVFTPQTPQQVAIAASEAFQLSETLGIPVLLQITGRLMGMDGVYELPRELDMPPPFDRLRPWGRFILDRHKNHFQNVWPEVLNHIETSSTHIHNSNTGTDGVISCGYVANVVDENVPHLSLGVAFPLPEKKIVEFLKPLKRVLVVEEIAPIIEQQVCEIAGKQKLEVEILGKNTGHIPRVGQIDKKHVDAAFDLQPEGLNFDSFLELSGSLNEVPCGGFEMFYQVLDSVLPEEHQVAGDVGCNILQGYFPPQTIDTAFGLGTPIGTAAGMSLSGRKGVAIIGDVGFLHSGINALLNAVEHNHDVLVIVLNNEIPAMTPGSLGSKGMARLPQIIESCGVNSFDQVSLETDQPTAIKSILEKRLAERGVNVLVVQAKPKPFEMGAS